MATIEWRLPGGARIGQPSASVTRLRDDPVTTFRGALRASSGGNQEVIQRSLGDH